MSVSQWDISLCALSSFDFLGGLRNIILKQKSQMVWGFFSILFFFFFSLKRGIFLKNSLKLLHRIPAQTSLN